MPTFPTQTFFGNKISLTYDRVVQYYVDGSTVYFLDGLGNVLFSVPSASIQNTVLTTDQTASWAISASWAPVGASNISISSSWASSSLSSSHAGFANWAYGSDVALLADTASVSVLADTASYLMPGGLVAAYAIKTTNYTLTTSDYTIVMSGSTNITAALPSATTNAGRVYNIKNVTPNTVFVSGSQNIDDATFKLINQWSTMTIQSNGSQWLII